MIATDSPTREQMDREILLLEGEPPFRLCRWCLVRLAPSRTKPRVFCSERCRKRVDRATHDRWLKAQVQARQLLRALEYQDAHASGISPRPAEVARA